MEKVRIEKLNYSYLLHVPPARNFVISAQDLLDIMDYCLQHAEELQQEAAQEKKEEDNQHG